MSKLPETCPICGARMKKGYVQGGSAGIFWSERKDKWRLHWDVEALVGGRFAMWMANAEAYRCQKCKIVLFSYGKEKQKE